jgi:replicative DNA helicase
MDMYSEHAEKNILGAVLLGDYLTVRNIIEPSDFFLLRHEIIFKTCATVFNQYGEVTYPLVSDALRANGHHDEIGGDAYLTSLVNTVDSTQYTAIYSHVVKRSATRRRVAEFAQTIDKRLQDTEQPINQIIDDMIGDLKTMHAPDVDDHVVDFSESLSTTFEQVIAHRDLYQKNKQYTLGIKTGLNDLDYQLDGLRAGDVTVFAGYTGAGKSAAVLTIALNASIQGIDHETQRPARVMIFSGEMTQFTMNNRLVSMTTGIPIRTIERGAFTEEQYRRYITAIDKLQALPLRFKRATRLSVEHIGTMIEQEITRHGLDLLILDGILQLDTTDRRGDQPDWLRINAIMETLEDVALKYNVAILATHQIGRSGAFDRPSLSDLKRSSAVEEKAARVLMLWKPSEDEPTIRELVIAKNRHGETGVVKLFFQSETTMFYNLQQ